MSAQQGPPPLNGVVVGLNDIYQQMLELVKTQAVLVGQVNFLIKTWDVQSEAINREIAQMRKDHAEHHKNHEDRILAIEKTAVVTPKAMWTAIGVILPIISLLVTIITIVAKG